MSSPQNLPSTSSNVDSGSGSHPTSVAGSCSSDGHPLQSAGGIPIQFDEGDCSRLDYADHTNPNDNSTSTGAMYPGGSDGGQEGDVGSPSGSEASVLAGSGSESLDNTDDPDAKEFLENMHLLLAIHRRNPEIVRSIWADESLLLRGAFLVLSRLVLGRDSELVPDSFWSVTERVSAGHRSLLPSSPPVIPDPATISHFQPTSRPNSADSTQNGDLLSPIHAAATLHTLEAPSNAPINNPTLSAIPSTLSSHMASSTSTSSFSAPSPLDIDDSQDSSLDIDDSQDSSLDIDDSDSQDSPLPIGPNRLPDEKVRRRTTSLAVATGVDAVEALVVPPGGVSPRPGGSLGGSSPRPGGSLGGSSPRPGGSLGGSSPRPGGSLSPSGSAVSGIGFVQRSATSGPSPRLPKIPPQAKLDALEMLRIRDL
ncbi:hypothetical protein DFP72DRAFT_843305 [Ephemerocybe angulata]|uniref:Uncharacterized protein n=1 Tax=Ephemerocybe angulata TaxID=980116 RepID=A0A8H6IAQ4_9AGAR|nr:hypothetical protein DFP72DRAFT_843305 [Tulosesus angulatus]